MKRRRRRNPISGFKLDEVMKWGAILIGLYFVYSLFQKAKQIGATATDIGNQVAEIGDSTADPSNATFASWYDPTQRSVFVYYLTFPDGNHHFVWASGVATDGTFTYSGDGMPYRIGVDKAGGLRAYFNP